VSIRRSSAPEIDGLIAELAADNPVRREAAVARLTVIGARAIDRLVAVVDSRAATSARVAALRILAGIANVRGLDAALGAARDPDPAVASAALSTAQAFLHGVRGTDVVDKLTHAVVDTSRPRQVRLAAMDALSELKASTLKPLWKALADDPDPDVRARAQSAESGGTPPDASVESDGAIAFAEGALPDDPIAVGRAVTVHGTRIALPDLHRLVEQIREREATASADRRADWITTRAAVHLALANRGSRLALYDLRESLESATAPLPVGFLAALTVVGDVSCLEAIASAYAKAGRSKEGGSDWWHEHLAKAFRAVVKRENITRRHAVMKKIDKRWGDAVSQLWREASASRSRA
jgi:HEAT repeat protein